MRKDVILDMKAGPTAPTRRAQAGKSAHGLWLDPEETGDDTARFFYTQRARAVLTSIHLPARHDIFWATATRFSF